MMRMGAAGNDDFETMLGQLGVRLNKQTILFNAETKAFAERRTGLLVSGPVVDIPSVEFDRLAVNSNPLGKQEHASLPPNPILAGMEIVADSLGKKLDIKINYPRPVYFDPPPGEKLAFAPEFMLTSAASLERKCTRFQRRSARRASSQPSRTTPRRARRMRNAAGRFPSA